MQISFQTNINEPILIKGKEKREDEAGNRRKEGDSAVDCFEREIVFIALFEDFAWNDFHIGPFDRKRIYFD